MAAYTTAVTVAMTSHGNDALDDRIVTFMIDDYYENSDNKLRLFYSDAELLFSNHEARVQAFDGTKDVTIDVTRQVLFRKIK